MFAQMFKGTNFEKFRYMYFSIVSLQGQAPFYPFILGVGRSLFMLKRMLSSRIFKSTVAFIYCPLLCVGSLISITILLLPQMSMVACL